MGTSSSKKIHPELLPYITKKKGSIDELADFEDYYEIVNPSRPFGKKIKLENFEGQVMRYPFKYSIGSGSFGIVFVARNKLKDNDEERDEKNTKLYAVKTVDIKYAQRNRNKATNVAWKEIDKQNFVKELHILSTICIADEKTERENNTRCMSYYGTYYNANRSKPDKSLKIVTEYLPGGELSAFLKRKGNITDNELAEIIYQTASGLNYLSSKGCVHRDIKPPNIMLARKGDLSSLRIIDFGLAGIFREEGHIYILHEACGTAKYVAPEIIDTKYNKTRTNERAKEPSYSSSAPDVFSLGIMTVMLITGGLHPFWTREEQEASKSASQYLYRHLREHRTVVPWATHKNFFYIAKGVQYKKLALIDLITSMLDYIPWSRERNIFLRSRGRITAAQIMKHPWVELHRTKLISVAEPLEISGSLESLSLSNIASSEGQPQRTVSPDIIVEEKQLALELKSKNDDNDIGHDEKRGPGVKSKKVTINDDDDDDALPDKRNKEKEKSKSKTKAKLQEPKPISDSE